MLTIDRDGGLCVIYSTSTRSTLELTPDELRELLSPTGLEQLHSIREALDAYESAPQRCERASDRLQRVTEQCHRDSVADPEPAPPTFRSPKGPLS